MTGALVQVRKSTISLLVGALVLGVLAYAWIGGGRQAIHPIVTEAARPLTGR